ncbi:hypothetical protein X798_06641, partial [Onchocerca flexuosa]
MFFLYKQFDVEHISLQLQLQSSKQILLRFENILAPCNEGTSML